MSPFGDGWDVEHGSIAGRSDMMAGLETVLWADWDLKQISTFNIWESRETTA